MSNQTLIDILRRRADSQPHERAYTYLLDGERDGEGLSWRVLDQRSRDVAAALRCCASPGERVLLFFPPGLDVVPAFFGSLFARTIAVLAYPPAGSRTDRMLLRLRGMAADASFSAVVSAPSVLAKKDWLVAAIPELGNAVWINSDEIPASSSIAEENAAPDEIALLQYTSGSTSRPRGVMVTHRNLLHNLASSASLAAHGPASVAVTWLPVNHDMGLIDGILQPAFSGFPVWVMSPAAFLQRPARWLEAISRLQATHSGGPDFAYDLCVRRIPETDRASLDLRTWRTAFNGSEPIRSSTLHAFQRAFGECGFRWEAFRPAYGLAESTLLVTSSTADEEPHVFHADAEGLRNGLAETAAVGRQSTALVSSGHGTCGTSVAIVDPIERTRCAPGRVGEIWVRGGSVAAGYWNKEPDTAATFNAHTADTGEGPFLRTGDLGFIRGGHLFVTGRIKDMLIVRGVKHYPQDIEMTVERAHAAIRPHCCAAFNMETDRQSGMVVVAELDQRPAGAQWLSEELTAITGAIAQAISTAHGFVPSIIALLEPGTLPRTTSGKIERYRCHELLSGSGIIHMWSCEIPSLAPERFAS
jgi:acyl-CoA synthetase (AMP-forming)/AMP-acid ligase II